MAHIVTLTLNPAVDLATEVPEVTPEHKLRCGPVRYDPGGGGINVARVVRELGGEAIALYTRGGPTGQLLEHLLEERGLTRRSIPIAAYTRESFTVAEAGRSREFRFILPGPTLTEREWTACLDAVAQVSVGASFIIASGSLMPGVPVDFYARVARLAKKLGARSVVDTAGEPLRAALEEGVHLAKPNRRELRDLTGATSEDLVTQAAAARELVGKGQVEVLVVSLGADGAMLTTRTAQLHARPPPVEPRSSVGAGDSFLAGMTLALSRGHPPEEALRWGIASGTAALLSAGTDLCHRADFDQLLPRVQPGPVSPSAGAPT
ncbi:1-phosphofructokinase family hexose kinase [Corallococcus sp. H22C18031201]|uniref:1-phosphofructokinase family hexose kinase n=1 Tax=Citreicoccus inhibens TaxID=2849499 RepID=UPI000E76ADB5|nr:1-phosphofructokinase family hexose kinase [Citreicoccus inhibens]MBU8895062.1 1-phosphofructokinase family hexose kinase [Citreicoccus inhibens]RJS27212.1 1-phosphofructokinase family hexose kinase [Corallococcus sp. H22C18031201]